MICINLDIACRWGGGCARSFRKRLPAHSLLVPRTTQITRPHSAVRRLRRVECKYLDGHLRDHQITRTRLAMPATARSPRKDQSFSGLNAKLPSIGFGCFWGTKEKSWRYFRYSLFNLKYKKPTCITNLKRTDRFVAGGGTWSTQLNNHTRKINFLRRYACTRKGISANYGKTTKLDILLPGAFDVRFLPLETVFGWNGNERHYLTERLKLR